MNFTRHKNYTELKSKLEISAGNDYLKYLTKEKDIVLVCSNCHRMLHRHRPWLSAVELKSVLLSKNKRIKAAR